MDAREDSVPAWFFATVAMLLLAFLVLAVYAFRGVLLPKRSPVVSDDTGVVRWSLAVKQHPRDSRARLELGYAYLLEKRYSRALEQYAVVITLEPSNTTAHFNSSTAYSALDRDDEAEASLLRVLEIQPDHIAAAEALGDYYVQRGRYDALLRTVGPVADRRPEAAHLQYLVGSACEHAGYEDLAADHYRLALQYSPGLLEARDALKRLLESR